MTATDTINAITQKLALGGSGPRVLVKECLGIAGLTTRCGSAAFADAPAETEHSAVVARLIERGAAIVGTVTMHELAFGMTGQNDFAGTAVNPNWPDRITGGSSSGSAAAVAAGLCDFAVGTDTGGSIRQPACCCGVYGLKPTFGAISRKGAIPRASSLDAIGPFAATARMLTEATAMMLDDFTTVSIEAPKLKRLALPGDDDIEAALDAALASYDVAPLSLRYFSAAYEAGMTLINAELAAEFGALARSNATLGDDVRGRLLAALKMTEEDVAAAEDIRAGFTAEVDTALADCDAIVMPTLPSVPPTLEEARDPRAVLPLTLYVRPFNLSGHPALTIPLRTRDGLPAGLQLVGRKGDEARLCALAEILSGETQSDLVEESL